MLVNELANTHLDIVTEFMLSNNVPSNKSLTFYNELLQMLYVIGLNMHDKRDQAYVDGLTVIVARKIINLNNPSFIN